MMNEVEFSRQFDIDFQFLLASWPRITLDARLAQAWILDLLAVGYEFPKLCLGGLGGFQRFVHWKTIGNP